MFTIEELLDIYCSNSEARKKIGGDKKPKGEETGLKISSIDRNPVSYPLNTYKTVHG